MKTIINTLVLVSIILILTGCKSEDKKQTPAELPKLTVGIQVSPAMALVMVAEDKKFFDKAGVDVEIKEFTAGKFALQAFLGGSLDVAVSGEVPVTLSTLQGHDFKVIAQVVERTVNECRVIARKDSDLDSPKEYFSSKKRKLSTSFGGGPEFYTYEFLKKYNINIEDVELISQKPQDMPAALASGTVDAISIFDPFARIAELQIGDSGITFSNDSLYSELYVADVMQKTIDEKPQELKAFLKGLYDAQLFIQKNEKEAKEIMIKYTKLDKEIVESIWGNFVFKPAINDLFVDYTTAQARWAIKKGTIPDGTIIPDFSNILYTDFLKEIVPSGVQLTK